MSDNADFNMEQVLRLMEMVKLFENINAACEQEHEAEGDGDSLRPLRAAIPYLDSQRQRNLNVLIKLLEVKKLAEAPIEPEYHPPTANDSWRIEALRAVRNELSGKRRRIIDGLIKIIGFNEMTKGMSN